MHVTRLREGLRIDGQDRAATAGLLLCLTCCLLGGRRNSRLQKGGNLAKGRSGVLIE